MPEVLELGHGHVLRWTRWAPDRDLNPQYEGVPDVERFGASVEHPLRPDDELCLWRGTCLAAVTFAGEVQARIAPTPPSWTVESWEPLTLSPSLACHCGDHGFVREGKWVPA